MANTTFASLKLTKNTEMNTFIFKGKEIQVLKYLPINDKYDLVTSVLQGALDENGSYYNAIKRDALFKVYLVYCYTNIQFTDKQREDPFKLYDLLESNGFFNDDALMGAIDKQEVETLFDYMTEMQADLSYYNTSLPAAIKALCESLPKNAKAAAEIVNNFDPEKFKEVADFSKAANGGRALTTNE